MFSEVTTRLPPELIYEIVSWLPHGGQSLHDCSLVAKSWIHPSQKRLFESIYIHSWNLRAWSHYIPPTNITLLGHVRGLYYDEYPEYGPETAYCALRDYFPSFSQLRLLSLNFDHTPFNPQRIKPFSAFKHTLLEVSLWDGSVTKSSIATLLNYFPNLACLGLHSLDYCKGDDPTPPLSRSLFKRLRVTAGSINNQVLFRNWGCVLRR